MTTKLDEGGIEAVATWLGRRTHGEDWPDLDERTRRSMREDASTIVTAYLTTANRLRPMSEAPHRGDNGRPYVLGYLEGDRKEPVMVWRFGKSMVDENRQHYQFEEFDGWLPLPEPVEVTP